MLAELRKGITPNPKLGFEHGNSGWKARGIEGDGELEKRIRDDGGKRNFDALSLKKVLKGLVVLHQLFFLLQVWHLQTENKKSEKTMYRRQSHYRELFLHYL